MYACTMLTKFNCQSTTHVKNAIQFYYIHVILVTLFNACHVCMSKDVGDGVTSRARALPLLPLLHKEISLQIKIIGNHVIIITEFWFL